MFPRRQAKDQDVTSTAPDRPAGAAADQLDGLLGAFDEPSSPVHYCGKFLATGWAGHPERRVHTVVLTVGREIIAAARVGEPSPLVAVRQPGLRDADSIGWSLELTHDPDWPSYCKLEAWALFEDQAVKGKRLGPLFKVAETTVEFDITLTQSMFMPLTQVSAGAAALVRGVAWSPAGVSRIEVSTDGHSWQRARHSLPSPMKLPVPSTPDNDLCGFETVVTIPQGLDEVVIRGRVVGLDGVSDEFEPMPVAVRPAADPACTDARLAVLRERRRERVSTLHQDRGTPAAPRVLVATHDLALGGAQLYLLDLLRGLRNRGFEFCLVAGRGGALIDEFEALGIPTAVVGSVSSSREELEGIKTAIASFAAEHGAAACLANTLPAFAAVSVARELGLPTIWAIHESFTLDVFWHYYVGEPLPDDLRTEIADDLAACDQVVFVAEATRELYAGLVARERGAVVPYGVSLPDRDLPERAEARADLAIDPETRVLLSVGTVEPRKGQLALARAFDRIPEEIRGDAELIIVGATSGSLYTDALREFADDERVGARLRVVDSDPDIERWHVASDVFVSASDVESMPRTMIEAMQLGRPVAGTDVFGVGELVEDGESGFLGEAGDLLALQRLLERTLDASDEELQRLGANAATRVRERHDIEQWIDAFAARLTQALDSNVGTDAGGSLSQ